jgi:two-component system, OmpR family, sensor histidine kinase VanS
MTQKSKGRKFIFKRYVNHSIKRKIFVYMLIFSLLIIGIIGIGTRFVLPAYYLQRQLDYLKTSEAIIIEAYSRLDLDQVVFHMEQMELELGGELYYYSEAASQQGYGKGNGKNRVLNPNSEKFIPSGDISIYRYTNKIGLDIHVIGVQMEENYLVYEVGIQTLNQAIDTMMDFILVLLAIVLLLAVLVSFVLSKTISKPIRELNDLAEAMKTKKIEPYRVTEGQDEISQLNQTLNELYEELQGNIYRLNAELNKERNAERLKKRFLAQATHELKTPIAVIRGYSEILYDGMYKDEEERDRFLKNIYDESEAVSRLILDVLDYTKMETGNYTLRIKTVKVHSYIDSLVERYRDFIEGQQLSFILENEVLESFCKDMDTERYDQIYKNLISNAVEHAHSLIKVRISIAGMKLRLSVYNDGLPIDDEDLPNVFESFYKKQGKKRGTGLGLAIVKEIVLLHHGEYRVENKDKGVEFVILI